MISCSNDQNSSLRKIVCSLAQANMSIFCIQSAAQLVVISGIK